MKKIAVLGSTGSIGRQCFKVIDAHPGRFEVVALAAGSNIALAAEQVAKYRPQVVSVATEPGARELCAALKKNCGRKDAAQPGLEILFGAEGIERVATHPDAEMVVSAAVGVVGLPAKYKAIEQGKQIALANKEVLVAAGEVVMAAVKRHGTVLLPVDSEHNAIHQCLRAGQPNEVKRLILTASGGPSRTTSLAKIAKATPKQALAHPNWKMGQRITIDSATLMNKGFEVIEAKWLFGVGLDKIHVVIHPQSTIHSMVEFVDGSVLAQFSVTDMRLPIVYALTYPDRVPSAMHFPVMDLRHLEFLPPDMEKFPCLGLAYEAAEAGGAKTVALNAADEVAVAAFLQGRIGFSHIPEVIREVLSATEAGKLESIEQVLEADSVARTLAGERVERVGVPQPVSVSNAVRVE